MASQSLCKCTSLGRPNEFGLELQLSGPSATCWQTIVPEKLGRFLVLHTSTRMQKFDQEAKFPKTHLKIFNKYASQFVYYLDLLCVCMFVCGGGMRACVYVLPIMKLTFNTRFRAMSFTCSFFPLDATGAFVNRSFRASAWLPAENGKEVH